MQELPLIRLVEIGKVLKPRGLKGELKCSAPLIGRFLEATGKKPLVIYIDEKPYNVTKLSGYNENVYIFLDNVTTVESAERFRNKKIFVNRRDLNLSDDEVLTSELVGFDVVDAGGKCLGCVKSIDNYGAGEICDCGEFSFPYEDKFVAETDMNAKKITVRL